MKLEALANCPSSKATQQGVVLPACTTCHSFSRLWLLGKVAAQKGPMET